MYIKVKVNAAAKKDALVQKAQDSFEVWTKAKARGGLANAAVKRQIAQYLGVEPQKLRLIKGAQSPSKIFLI